MSDFSIIRPITITDAMLSGASIAEPAVDVDPDPAVWNSALGYSVGARVSRIVAGVHKVFQCVAATLAGTATPPESQTDNWVAEGPTNRWRCFDASNSSQSTANGSITFTLTPGQVADAMMFDNVEADSIRVQVAGTAYDQTIQLRVRGVNDWWKYFFEPFSYRKAAVFFNIPLFPNNVITVTITKVGGGIVKVGTCILGLSKVIGTTQSGVSVGIKDYSVKETNKFGVTTVAERVYSKRMDPEFMVPNSQVDDVFDLLSSYRAKPIVWIGAGNQYSCLIMYGYFEDFGIVIPSYPLSRCTARIQGLT